MSGDRTRRAHRAATETRLRPLALESHRFRHLRAGSRESVNNGVRGGAARRSSRAIRMLGGSIRACAGTASRGPRGPLGRLRTGVPTPGRAKRRVGPRVGWWRVILDPSKLAAFTGAVAQLGERSVRNAEVVGSTPIGSTNTRSQAGPERPISSVSWRVRSIFSRFTIPSKPRASPTLRTLAWEKTWERFQRFRFSHDRNVQASRRRSSELAQSRPRGTPERSQTHSPTAAGRPRTNRAGLSRKSTRRAPHDACSWIGPLPARAHRARPAEGRPARTSQHVGAVPNVHENGRSGSAGALLASSSISL